MQVGIVTALLLGLWASVNGHSWLHCTDYRVPEGNDFYTMPELLDSFDPDRCQGYPRDWANIGGDVQFGVEPNILGHNDMRNRSSSESVCGPAARKPSDDLSQYYTEEFPMAVYTPGQRVCMTWPSKSHRSMDVKDTSTGQSVFGGNSLKLPDGGLHILRSDVNPVQDDTKKDILDWNGPVSNPNADRIVAFLGKSEQGVDDMKGFANCPAFSLHKYTVGVLKREFLGLDPCGQCFIVPELEAGIYTFYWHWKFNNKVEGFNIGPGDPDEEYITCFDVEISSGSTETCPLAGDNGRFPGNRPNTGRELKPGVPPPKQPGYSDGGPLLPSSVEPCTSSAPATSAPTVSTLTRAKKLDLPVRGDNI